MSNLNLPSKVAELIDQVNKTPGYSATRLGTRTHIMDFTGPNDRAWQTSIMLDVFVSALGHINLRNQLKNMIGWEPSLFHQINMTQRQSEVQNRVRLDAAAAGVSVDDLAARMRSHAEAEIAKANKTITRDVVVTAADAAKLLSTHYGAAQYRAAALGVDTALHDLPDDVVTALREGRLFKRQRNLDDRVLRTTVKLMLTSNWRWVPDPVAIATDGFVVNGLSRLTAVFQVPNGCVPLRIITKAPSDIGAFIDNGRPRTIHDALHVYGIKYANVAKGALDLVMWYDEETTDPLAWLTWNRFTWPIGAVSFEAVKHTNLINNATRFAESVGRRAATMNPRPLISKSALTAAHHILHRDRPLPNDTWNAFLTDAVLGEDTRVYTPYGTHVADLPHTGNRISTQLQHLLVDYDLPKITRPGSHVPPTGKHARSVEQLVLILHAAKRFLDDPDGEPLSITDITPLPYFTDRSSISAYLDGNQ